MKVAITPLGAAVVEALPDQQKVRKIEAEFKLGECPTSAIFPTQAHIKRFYARHNKTKKG